MVEILRFAQDDSLFCLAMMEGEQGLGVELRRTLRDVKSRFSADFFISSRILYLWSAGSW